MSEVLKLVRSRQDHYSESFENNGLAPYAELPVQTTRRLRKLGGPFKVDTITLFAYWCGYRAHFDVALSQGVRQQNVDALAKHIESVQKFAEHVQVIVRAAPKPCEPSSPSV